jgi:O-antigen/teichoic acid export membrane protein
MNKQSALACGISGFKSNPLAWGSAVMFAGSMVANVGSYLYHLLMGRALGPVGYGELSSLVSILYIFGVPILVLQTVLVKYFAQIKANRSVAEAKDLYIRVLKYLGVAILGGAGVFFLLSPVIANFLHLPSFRLIIWLYVTFGVTILASINGGFLLGYQMFIWLSVITGGSILLKLAISLPLAEFGVEWVMIATVISTVLSYLLGFIPVRFIFAVRREHFALTRKAAVNYSIPTFLTLFGVTSLYSTDIILVKHFFSADTAGVYAAVSLLGKIIYFASSSIVTVIYPIIVEKATRQQPVRKIVNFAVLFISGISVMLSAGYLLLPNLVTGLLFGSTYSGAVPYLGTFAVFISFFSLANLFAMVNLGIGRTSAWFYAIIAAFFQIILIYYFHNTLTEVILINSSVSLTLFAALVILYIRPEKVPVPI